MRQVIISLMILFMTTVNACVFADESDQSLELVSNAKIGDSLQRELPAPLYSPLVSMIVDIFLKDCTMAHTSSLQPYVRKVLYKKDGVVEAEVRADKIKQIADLPYVSFINFPRQSVLHTLSAVDEQDLESSRDPKICSFLAERFGPEEQRPPIQGIAGGRDNIVLLDIYISEFNDTNFNDLKPHLKSLRYARDNIVEADVSLLSVPAIKDLSYVSYISLPRLQYRDCEGNGLVQSEAVMKDLMKTCTLHGEGITGKGVSVAVTDSNFFFDDITKVELPSSMDMSLVSSNVYSIKQWHGTACSEIIADVAPGANQLFVDTGSTEMSFIDALENLTRQGKKIDLVSSSMDFPVGMFDGEDDVCLAVRNLTRNGTIWVNAAGNWAQRHWSGNFKDGDGDGINEFSQEDESINITARKGETIEVILSWDDDWEHASEDYDLYVYSPRGGYAQSRNPQTGYFGHSPVETISLDAPVSGVYEIKIRKVNATRDRVLFNLIAPKQDLDEYRVVEGSLGVLSCSNDVITVGALDAVTGELAPYSSRGPTADGRIKPDIVAPTNVTVSSSYPYKFEGTSAAAPHASGCVALLHQKFGNPGCDIKSAIIKGADDFGDLGPDNAYGYGLINASSANCN